jgi:hypothetical protein
VAGRWGAWRPGRGGDTLRPDGVQPSVQVVGSPARGAARAGGPERRGRRAAAATLLALALCSTLLSTGTVLLTAAASAAVPAEAPGAWVLPWIPNAPLRRSAGGAAPCTVPDEPTYGIVDPCPTVDWALELEVRRAGGIRAGRAGR